MREGGDWSGEDAVDAPVVRPKTVEASALDGGQGLVLAAPRSPWMASAAKTVMLLARLKGPVRSFSGVAAFLPLLLTPAVVSAQVLQGSLTGTVTDASGAVVPGAAITVVSPATGFTREGKTNAAGIYTFSDILPGTYNVTISAPGFGTFKQSATPIAANGIARVDVALKAGAQAQEITVTDEAPPLETDRAETSYNISEQQLSQLPTTSSTGRNFQALYRLVPGATPPGEQNSSAANPQRSQASNINGVSNSAMGTRVDGALDQSPYLPANVAYVPPQDAIQTVNVVTGSYNAEQGTAGGAAINVILKSGTNQFHGSIFEYNTISQFDARSYFQTTAALPRIPKYVFNEYGGSVGGPIIKNKLFFFGDWDSVHVSQTISGITSIPVMALRTGNFSSTGTTIYNPFTGNAAGAGKAPYTGNQVPVSSAAAILLANLPAPNYGGVGAQINNYFGSTSTTTRRDNIDAKITYAPSESTTFYGHYSVSPSQITDPQIFGTNPGGTTWDGGQPGISPGLAQMVVLNATHTFTPHLLLDANAGFTRMRVGAQSYDLSLGDYGTQVLKIPGTNYNGQYLYGGIPEMNISYYAALGNSQGANPFLFRDNQYTGNLNLTYNRGRHGLRFGGEYIHTAINHFQPQQGNPRGNFLFTGGASALAGTTPNNFNAFADFLIGTPTSVTKGVQTSNPIGVRWSSFAFYGQDTFEASKNLTLNVGVRYEYYTLPVHAHGGLYQYDPSVRTTVTDATGVHTVGTVLIGGSGNTPEFAGVTEGWGMLLPRLGVDYRFNEKTVVRAGYGVTFDPQNNLNERNAYPSQIALSQSGATSYTYATTLTTGIPTIATPDLTQPQIPLPYNITSYFFPKNFRRGYIESYNLAVQRELPASLVATVAYVGTRSLRQQAQLNINAAPIGGGNAGRLLNTTYGANTSIADQIEMAPFRGGSYNGLQTQLSHRSEKSVSTGIAYTYSKAMDFFDNGLGNLTFAYPAYWDMNYALAGYDRKHNFQWWSISPSPFGRKGYLLKDGFAGKVLGGWQLQTILSWVSGTPFTVGASSTPINAPGNSQVADRLVSHVNILGAHHQSGGSILYFDPADYATPPGTRFGNSGRNSLRGPGTFDLDAGLKRVIHLYEGYNLELQAEAFNATNTPSFGNPGATVGSGTFATITSAGNGRRVRLSGRITF